MTLPAPHDLEVAAERSTKNVTVSEISNMLSMYEPTSLAKLSRKGAEMHDTAIRGIGGLKVSPRNRGDQGASPMGNMGNNRRSSSHFREMPVNVIPENADANDEQDSSEEEKKDNSA